MVKKIIIILFVIFFSFILFLLNFVNPLEGDYTGSFFGTADSVAPNGITQNGTYFWITDTISNEVYQYWINGTYTGTHFDTAGCGNGAPRSITQNGTYFWIVDVSDKKVYKYWMNGTYLENVSISITKSPSGIDIDSNYIWISQETEDKVVKYWKNGTYIASYSSTHGANMGVSDLTINGTFYWLTDSSYDSVYKYWINGTYTNSFFNVSGAGLSAPYGITQNGSFFWITDVVNDTVFKFYMNGSLVGSVINPKYYYNQTNTTDSSKSVLFSLYTTDDESLYPRGTYIFSTNNTGSWVNDSVVNFTTSNSWANVTKLLSATPGITIGYRWYLKDNAQNINNTDIYMLVTTDATPPQITYPSNSTITYLDSLFVEFDADETIDTWSINDTTRFKINSSGSLENNTVFSAGTYLVNVSANDTSGNMNYSMWQVVVSQYTEDIYNLFNTTSPIVYPNSFKVFSNASTAFKIYRNGTEVTNNSEQALASGTYNFTTIRTDQTNYSDIYDEQTFQVDKGTPTGTITGTNPITYLTAGDITGTETNEGDSGCSYKLYRDEVEVTNPDTTILGAGSYDYVYNTTGCDNYSASASLDTLTLTVNQNAETVYTLFNVTSPITYPTVFNVFSNASTTFIIYRNGTEVTNASTQGLTAGTYNFTTIRTDSSNYSDVYDEQTFQVNKATTALGLIGTTPITYGATSDFAGASCPGVLTCTLNDTNKVFGVGTVTFNYSTPGNENFTSNWTIKDLVINQDTQTFNIFSNETSPITYPNSFLVYSNSTETFILYRNGTEVANNSIQGLASGTYNFTIIKTDQVNYSNVYNETTFQVDKATLSGSLNSSNGSWTIERGFSTNVSYYESNLGDSDVNYTIYNNSYYILNNTKLNESIGNYMLVLNSTGGANYSSNNNISTQVLTFSDNTPPFILLEKPKNIQYAYDTGLPLNFTVSDYNLDSCWIKVINSTDDIIFNNQSVTGCLNTTFDVPRDDTYNLTLWANDTSNNKNYSSVQFQTVTTAPAISLDYPSDNYYFNTTQNIYFNFTATSLGVIDYGLFYTNFTGSWIINETFRGIISATQNYTIKNLTDGVYRWNMWYNDTVANSGFSIANRTIIVDTTLPFVNIDDITTTAGSQTITFSSREIDANLQSCKYSIYNSLGAVDGLNNNISFTCNIDTSATVTAYGTYNLTVYSTDYANNLNSSTSSFTTSAIPLTVTGGGGGGGSVTEQKFPVIGIDSINSSKIYSELDKAIIYSQINSYCSNKVRNEPLAIADYSKSCTLIQSDLNTLLPTLKVSITMNDLVLFYKNYKESDFFQFYATQKQISDYDLFTSVLGLTTMLQLNPSSLDKPVLINVDGRNYTLTYNVVSNKPLKSCAVIEGDINAISCTVTNSTVTIRYLLNDTRFFNEIFKGVISVQTDAPANQLESKKLPVVFRVYNFGWNVLGIPIIFFIIIVLLVISSVFFIGYKVIPKRKVLNIKNSLELGA